MKMHAQRMAQTHYRAFWEAVIPSVHVLMSACLLRAKTELL